MNIFRFTGHVLIHRISALKRFEGDAFLRDFTSHVLHDVQNGPAFALIERIRSVLLQNQTLLPVQQPGAGSRKKLRTIAEAVRVASVNPRFGRLLFRLTARYKPSQVIELGTAAGISTLYLSFGNPDAEVITVEGNPQLASLAAGNVRLSGLNHVTVLNAAFDEALPFLTSKMAPDSLVFIDGNHTASATLQYFTAFTGHPDKKPILVFDDINWSDEMRTAWKMIQKQLHTGIIVDLFFMGIYFNNSVSPLQIVRYNY